MLKHFLFVICGLLLFVGAFATTDTLRAQSSSRLFDGGKIGQVKTNCTCSGGVVVEFESYVDNKKYEYVYQLGTTQLYAYYNIYNQGGYFLDTHVPYGICLVVNGTSCQTEGNPDGTLIMLGTS